MWAAPVPHRREPRHAVPHLDEGVGAAHPPGQLGDRGAGEHRVAAAPADDPVAVAAVGGRQADGGRRAVDDVQPGRGPPAHQLVGVDLGPAGVGVVEVPPGQHVHAPDPGLDHVADERADLVLRGSGAGISRTVPAPSRPEVPGVPGGRTTTMLPPMPAFCSRRSAPRGDRRVQRPPRRPRPPRAARRPPRRGGRLRRATRRPVAVADDGGGTVVRRWSRSRASSWATPGWPTSSPTTRSRWSASTSASSARSTYAYVWETWPDTAPTGDARRPGVTAAVSPAIARLDRGRHPPTPTCSSSAPAPAARPTAALLAEAGFDVLVLEEGPLGRPGRASCRSRSSRWTASTAPAVSPSALGLPVDRLHRGLLRRRRHRGQQRALPPPAGGGARPLAPRTADRSTSTPTSCSRICDEVEQELLGRRPCPARSTAASEALRRGADALGWRHDEIPRWMAYPTGRRRDRTAPEHDRDLPAAGRGARAPDCSPSTVSTAWCSTRGAALRAEVTTTDGRAGARSTSRTSSSAAARSRRPALLQRSGLRRHIGATLAVHPTVKLAARFDEPVNVPTTCPSTRSRSSPPTCRSAVRPASPGLVALALTDNWAAFGPAVARLAQHRGLLRRDHQRGPRPGASRCPACATRSSPTA